MIELTEEQQRELGKVDANEVCDPRTGETYVLVKAAQYERMRATIASPTRRATWDDPALDACEQYRTTT